MVPIQAVALLPGVVAAIDRSLWTGVEVVGSAAVSFVATAVGVALVGVIVSAVAPDFTDSGVEYLHAEPGEAFLYGLVAYVGTTLAMVLLAVTIIGLVVVIPAVIVLAILSFGGTAVSAIALGAWIRSLLGLGAATGRGPDLVVGAVAWAALGLVPVLGGLVRFVVGAMGFGYLALWIANGRFDRDYGSFDAGRYGGTGGSTHGRGSLGEDDEGDGGADREGDDDPDRFRNIAALDAEREAEANERGAESDASDETDQTGRER